MKIYPGNQSLLLKRKTLFQLESNNVIRICKIKIYFAII